MRSACIVMLRGVMRTAALSTPERTRAPQVVTDRPRAQLVRAFLDGSQYSAASIRRYERMFGKGFVSTGGLATTQVSLCR